MKPHDILTWARKKTDRTQREVIESAAKATGFSRRTIYHWLATGRVPEQSQRWLEFETGGKLKAARK